VSAVRDLQAYLMAEGLIDGSSGWPSSRSGAHDDSERLVVFAPDGGSSPEIPAVSGIGDTAMQDPAVHVTVRGAVGERDEAEEAMEALRFAAHGKTSTSMGSILYFRVAARSEPVMYFDDRNRPNFTVSFRMMSLVPI
jgi:hypothetical protein